jgi:hypothetical protein
LIKVTLPKALSCTAAGSLDDPFAPEVWQGEPKMEPRRVDEVIE